MKPLDSVSYLREKKRVNETQRGREKESMRGRERDGEENREYV